MWLNSLMIKQFFNVRFRCCYKSATSESVVWCPVPRLKQQLSVRAAVTLVPARLPLSLHKHLFYYFECSVCNQLLKWSKISAVPVPFASTAFVNQTFPALTLLCWGGLGIWRRCLLGTSGVFQACPSGRTGQTQDTLDRLHLPASLGTL